MTVTRTFTPDELAAMGIPNDWEAEDGNVAEILHDEQTDTRRWSSTHRLVFRAPDDGKTYRVNYQLPLTEHQEADRWFGDDTIRGVEVVQVPVTVQEWKPADDAQQAPASAAEPLAPDTLPAWLYQRFERAANTRGWGDLDDADQSYWAHHAAAVRRAVARDGFKTSAGGAK